MINRADQSVQPPPVRCYPTVVQEPTRVSPYRNQLWKLSVLIAQESERDIPAKTVLITVSVARKSDQKACILFDS